MNQKFMIIKIDSIWINRNIAAKVDLSSLDSKLQGEYEARLRAEVTIFAIPNPISRNDFNFI